MPHTHAITVAGANPLILIADDEAPIRTALGDLLRLQGYRVVEAGDGDEALRLADAHQPDLVLMDLVLPGIDGISATHRLRRTPSTAAIPVIAATASWLGEQPGALLAAGFSGALRKPFSAEALTVELRRVLGCCAAAVPV